MQFLQLTRPPFSKRPSRERVNHQVKEALPLLVLKPGLNPQVRLINLLRRRSLHRSLQLNLLRQPLLRLLTQVTCEDIFFVFHFICSDFHRLEH